MQNAEVEELRKELAELKIRKAQKKLRQKQAAEAKRNATKGVQVEASTLDMSQKAKS